MLLPWISPQQARDCLVKFVVQVAYNVLRGHLVCRECALPLDPGEAVAFTEAGCPNCGHRQLRWEWERA